MPVSNKNTEFSRRGFMTLSGTVAGLAALAAMGLNVADADATPNISTVNANDLSTITHETDVLVIGTGMAGLFAAVKAHDAGAKVLMVSKGRLGASGLTPFARGIFSYDPTKESMSQQDALQKIARSSLNTNNPVYTRQLMDHSKARVEELRSWGFFKSKLMADAFSKPIEERSIPVLERIMLTHLIKENGCIAGAAGFNFNTPEIHLFKAKSVVLCTGAGGFKPNGFPVCELTHDGTVMAYEIGARVTGKEWNDGHPGNLKHSAAVYEQWQGEFERKPSTTGVNIRHDLGVNLCYSTYKLGPTQEAMNGPGGMDGQNIPGGPYRPAGYDRPGPPPQARPDNRSGDTPGRKQGPPGMANIIPSGGASAGMAIHKSEGLVPVDDKCGTDIPGLYAAGDALGSYMAGAIYTQIGSSLAGSAVQGAIAGEAAASHAAKHSMPTIPSARIDDIQKEILAPLRRKRGYSPAWVTQTLQGIMIPNFILYIKKGTLLQAALAYVEELRDHHTPMLRAADLHELRLAHETRNMIISAEMKLRASLMRTESRCSHYRLDYPKVDTENWNAWINLRKGDDGTMQLEKQPFDSWPT